MDINRFEVPFNLVAVNGLTLLKSFYPLYLDVESYEGELLLEEIMMLFLWLNTL